MSELFSRFNKQTYLSILSLIALAIWNIAIGGNLFGYLVSIVIYFLLCRLFGLKLLNKKENKND